MDIFKTSHQPAVTRGQTQIQSARGGGVFLRTILVRAASSLVEPSSRIEVLRNMTSGGTGSVGKAFFTRGFTRVFKTIESKGFRSFLGAFSSFQEKEEDEAVEKGET